jgi:hypothetical protein
MFQHSGEIATAISDCERVRAVVPMNGNYGISPVFIVVIVALVFVKIEVGVRSPINT